MSPYCPFLPQERSKIHADLGLLSHSHGRGHRFKPCTAHHHAGSLVAGSHTCLSLISAPGARVFDLDRIVLDEHLLSLVERERVERKATPGLKHRQAASFQCLRQTLGELLRLPPEAVPIAIAAGGKPYLAGVRLAFNLSHSHGVALVAWGPHEIGVDVEALIARPTDELARTILSPAELDCWRATPAAGRAVWLTRAWTRKEATLKAVGSGLRIPPERVEVMTGADEGEVWTMTLDGRRWSGTDWTLEVPSGYRAAICREVIGD